MTRSIKASAAATLAGLVTVAGFASAAQACISCQYVPEVVREHQSHSSGASYGRAHVDMAAIAQRKAQAARAAQAQAAQARMAQTRMAQARMAAQQRAARQAAAERRIETASIEPAKSAKETVTVAKTTASGAASGSYALLKSDTDKTQSAATDASTTVAAATPVEPATAAQPEPAPAAKAEKPAAAEKTAEAVGCKRFIPAVGVTLSIACN